MLLRCSKLYQSDQNRDELSDGWIDDDDDDRPMALQLRAMTNVPVASMSR